MINSIFQDLRFALRVLAKKPGFTAVVVLTLALGIGANTAIFSIVDATLLKPGPNPDPDRLFVLWEKPPGEERNGVSAANFLDWRQQNHTFSHMAAITGESYNFSLSGEPEQIGGARVSPGYFELLGRKIEFGRSFLPEEEESGKDHVVILNHAFWKQRFGADTNLIGQSIRLNGEQYAVIGIFKTRGDQADASTKLWTPLSFGSGLIARDFHYLRVTGRLKPGVTRQQAQADMDAVAAGIATTYPDLKKGWGVTLDSWREFQIGKQLQQTLLILLGTVACVLLIACTNVTNLMLTRALARQKEFGIRIALGAGRWRLMRQFLVESSLLSLLGGAAGWLLGYGLLQCLTTFVPTFGLPDETEITMNYRILLFTFGIALLSGLLFGFLPAWRACRPDVNEALKEGTRGTSAGFGRTRLRSALVILEIAMALMLLAGAGLLLHSFSQLQKVKPGFEPHNVLTMSVALPTTKYSTGPQVAEFYRRAIEKIEALPGVEHAAAATALPMRGWGWGMWFSVEGKPVENRVARPTALFRMVSPKYFTALKIPLLKGRNFTEQDRFGAQPVTIISETMAQRHFPEEDPIGKRLVMEALIVGQHGLGPPVSWEIVGVAGDVKTWGLDGKGTVEMAVPLDQSPQSFVSLAIRTSAKPMSMVNAVKSAIYEIDKDQPLISIQTMDEIVSERLSQPRFRMLLVGAFALVALALAVVGIYGVMSFSVAQRTNELGIRMALGAQRGDVLWLVLRNGMKLALIGVGVGLAAAFALTRVMTNLLFEVKPTDPFTFVSVSLLLLMISLCACWLPARRATKVDPMVALRYE